MKSPVLIAVALLAGCGAAPQNGEPALTFEAAPFETVVSASGRLKVEVRWSPATPIKGQNAVQLTFLNADGSPVEGVSADVVPWMPAHGHGTSIRPAMTQDEPGVEIASPVFLYMSGTWQLRMTLSGAVEDTAVTDVQIR